MELRSLQSPTVNFSSIPRSWLLLEKQIVYGNVINFPLSTSSKKRHHPHVRNLKNLVDLKARTSGTIKSGSVAVEAIPKDDLKNEYLVFVAGATGRVGSRTVRELLKLGLRVRAGVRSAQRAQSLVKSVQQMKLDEATLEGTQPIEKLEVVECDLEKPDQIRPALGDASIIICCIGASEKEVFDVTGPCRIDYRATKNLIEAASAAKVNHFILLTSLGTNKVGFPAAVLNLFWGVLIWKRKAEESLLASGIPYTIVRPGGMERPTDSYKETHNITLSLEDTLFGGQVSNLQVAELMAFMAKNRSLSYCKVVEVIAETTAPLTPIGELLEKIPAQRFFIDPDKGAGITDVPGPAISESIGSETPATSSEKEPAKAIAPRPLSPYFAYEDLKPPTSPTPTPSNVGGASKAAVVPATTEPAEPSSISIKKEAIQTEVKTQSLLSPYINYGDLKPPVSPSPEAPGSIKAEVIVETVANLTTTDSGASATSTKTVALAEPISATVVGEITRPLSPYTVYEDLKPPSSPSPTPSGRIASLPTQVAWELPSGNDVAKTEAAVVVEKDSPDEALTSYILSPYHVYDDLKPPTSPSPRSPTISIPSMSPPKDGGEMTPISGNGAAQPSAADISGNEQHHTAPNPRPLSPFTMYDDLKPPSSPMPSSK